MNYEDLRSFNELHLKANSYYDKQKYRDAIPYFTLANDIARHNADLDKQVLINWSEANCWQQLEEYETALTKYTWIISNVENTQTELNKSTLETIIRSFCDWVDCAAKIPAFDEQGLIEIFDEGERYMFTTGHIEIKASFLHSKSMALITLRLYDEALIVAEEGLALKRLNPYSPGCDIKHHTQVYADILSLAGRIDEAISLLDDLIFQYTNESDTWSMRASLYLRKGDYYSAIEDYTEAVFQNASAGDYNGRAIAYALAGRPERAVEDFKNALKEDRHDDYSALWLAGITRTYSRLRPIAESNKWLSNIAKFYLGELDKDSLLDLLNSISSRRSRTDRLCMCYTHIGLFYESSQNLALAKHYYQLSIDTKAFSEYAYIWAKAKLEQL